MSAISLKLPEQLLVASGECAAALQLSRAEYIRRALELMNRDTRARLRADRLRAVSHRVRRDSMRINAEFDAIEGDVDA
ncbi:MAG: CopG family transcriptional regulator [Acidobacteria bacterium]|nr:CopG family transcriptional regulator [Acidobacteriota bacterium]